MNFSTLSSISPIDGRYHSKTKRLSKYFSEYALIQYRIKVEVLYFIALSESGIPQLSDYSPSAFNHKIEDLYEKFSSQDAENIKEKEAITNHDVKAVEYFIKEKFTLLGLEKFTEFIHFGLTSQDINNVAIPLSIKDCLHQVIMPEFAKLVNVLKEKASQWGTISMLARTHGQPASPTLLGKEMQVFIVRLQEQIKILSDIPIAGKFGGATGNFNAHFIAYPHTDWHKFAQQFLDRLGIKRSFPTTQIEHYDHLANLFDCLKRINTILIDFSRDVWHYISIGYFTQKITTSEVGSSAMPHKVNPIDFENAEGNLGLSNALFEHLSSKLPISRLQRDLTDSTVLRNVGVPFGHLLISLTSLHKGLNKIDVNKKRIEDDLEDNWVIVAEAVQTILRREGFPKPYETLKKLTRSKSKITKNTIHEFIEQLDIQDVIKEELKKITPSNYIGK